MLSSIHPFGERSRSNSFSHTALAHIVGSTLGGAALGALAGLVGVAVDAVLTPSVSTRSAIVLVATVAALAIEATRRQRLLPTRSRQVNENWIQSYRGWVYGVGWGAELGFGISTIITTALVHLLVVTMIFAGSFSVAVLLGSTFGLVRGATILGAIGVDSPERLRLLHQRLDALRSRSQSGVVLSLIIATAFGLGGVL